MMPCWASSFTAAYPRVTFLTKFHARRRHFDAKPSWSGAHVGLRLRLGRFRRADRLAAGLACKQSPLMSWSTWLRPLTADASSRSENLPLVWPLFAELDALQTIAMILSLNGPSSHSRCSDRNTEAETHRAVRSDLINSRHYWRNPHRKLGRVACTRFAAKTTVTAAGALRSA